MGQIEAGFEPQPKTHRWQTGIGAAGGIMRGRVDKAHLCLLNREAQCMGDHARLDFVVAHQSGENRQASRIGGSPGIRPQRVGVQVEHSARTGIPARSDVAGMVQFIQLAVIFIDNQRMPVAARLNGRVGRKWIRAWIALVRRFGEVYGHKWLCAGNDDIRNAVGWVAAKIRMEMDTRTNGVDIIG